MEPHQGMMVKALSTPNSGNPGDLYDPPMMPFLEVDSRCPMFHTHSQWRPVVQVHCSDGIVFRYSGLRGLNSQQGYSNASLFNYIVSHKSDVSHLYNDLCDGQV